MRNAVRSELTFDNAPRTQPARARLLIVLNSLHLGGSERKTVRLANALSAQGYRIVLAHLSEPDTLRTDLDPAIECIHLSRRGKFSFTALNRLRRIARMRRVDAVLAVNLYATLYGALVARELDVPCIASVNTTEFNATKLRIQMMLLYGPILQRVELLLFGAAEQRVMWLDRYLQARRGPSGVLYNGVDVDYFDPLRVPAPMRPADWPASRFVIGTVAALRPEKSHHHLLQALRELVRRGVDAGVVIVGEGRMEARLRRLTSELHLNDRVCFAGAARDVRPHVAAFDVFALTSTAVETFSNAVLEALAMARPVVSSRVGGMAEMLRYGGGRLYPVGDVQALTDALYELATRAELRTTLGRQAREVAVEHFSLQLMVDTFRTHLEQLLDRRTHTPCIEVVEAAPTK